MKHRHKKASVLAAVRHTVQLAAFLLFPGLFISAFSALESIYTAVIGGSFDASALSQQLILTVSILLITAVMGRFFCGFLCSFGAMGDLLWFIRRTLKLPRLKVSETADRLLKKLKYVVLPAIAVFIWTFGLNVGSGIIDPWTIFGMYASVKGWPSAGYLVSIGGLLLLLIMLGSLFIERFFCRYFCPLGGIFAVVSRFRLFWIKKPGARCGACRACTAGCAMGIPLYRGDNVTSGECIDCFDCVRICPRNNVTANPAPAAAAMLTVTALTGLYYVGNLSAGAIPEGSAAAVNSEAVLPGASESGRYSDGVYTGSADGYRGTTKVRVTVENGTIANIEILSCGDDEEFFSRAKAAVIADILAAQDTGVDTVSGATFSSLGIINAVADALTGAGGDTQTAEGSAPSSVPTGNGGSESSAPSSSPDTGTSSSKGSLSLSDGVYSGSGTGFRGTTAVSVTVAGGVITDITIASYQDDAPYFSRAESAIIPEILAAQSVNVDTVSGATFSSNGLLEAVANALKLDFTNPNSSSPAGSGHGGHGGRGNA